MEEILVNIANVYVFLDDILIVTKGTKEEHDEKVREVFKELDSRKLHLKEDKCKIAKNEIEWLGFDISEKGVKPHNEKIQGISGKMKSKNLKDLRSYLGAVNQLIKFIHGLAQLTEPFRDLLKTDGNWEWKEKHDIVFDQVQKRLQNIINLSYFNRENSLRIICDASHQGLGALLLQEKGEKEWDLISCASRYLSNYEMKYSTNELELLAIVWAVEQFRTYIYGTKLEKISDHKALETALKSNHGNKTYSSRLTRWIDRLLPFDMEVIHQPGRTQGLADYLSCHSSEYNEKEWSKKAKELWESWFVVNSVEEINKDYYINHRLNKLFNQPIGIEQSASERTESENAASSSRISKHSQMSRLQASREKNAVRNLTKTSKSVPNKQIVQSQNLKTSPIQLIVSSIEENNPSTSTERLPEVEFLKVKTLKEINDIMLMANYQSDSGLQNVREAVFRRDVSFLRKENKLFKPVFKDLRVDRELVFFENRLVIPREMRQAVLNSIHSGHRS